MADRLEIEGLATSAIPPIDWAASNWDRGGFHVGQAFQPGILLQAEWREARKQLESLTYTTRRPGTGRAAVFT
jgi:hypothetical protein